MAIQWQDRYALRVEGMISSAVREILKFTQQPDVISFAGGLPSPEAFPLAEIERAACRLLEERGAQALQYSPTEGYAPLREFIVDKMARSGVRIDESNVLLTTGSQQALDLVGKILLDPIDTVLCEAPSYLGALQAFRAYQARFATVPIDDDGMRVAEIEPILRSRQIKIIYALPNFQNPAGTTIPLHRRQDLVSIARESGVALIEDDPYGELRYEGEHLPPLLRLDEESSGGEQPLENSNVIYMSTFSKTLAPGLRLGWIVAPTQVIEKLVQAKQGADLHSSTFDQMLAYEIVKEDNFFTNHIQRIRAMYKVRRDAMLEAMQAHFPRGVQWTRPQGGLFLWVTLPLGMDAGELLMQAVKYKVAFVSGRPFFPPSDLQRGNGHAALPVGHNTMRLNFSNASPEMIREGIKRLGHAIEIETKKTMAIA
jgi:2-aminoadipate transaminase